MTCEAARIGLSFERLVAVDGERLDLPLRAQFFAGERRHEPALTAGEIGCYASHLLALQIVANDDTDDCALVFEDDVRLADDLPRVIDAARKRLGRWDIVRLSNAPKTVVLPLANLGGGRELVRYRTIPNSAAGYLISRTGARKFLDAYANRTLPIDEDFRRPWHSCLDTYGIVPPPVVPGACLTSTIDGMGRERRLAARVRFKDAAAHRDIVPAFRYRLKMFGALGFYRGLARSIAISIVKRTRGRSQSETMCRLKRHDETLSAA